MARYAGLIFIVLLIMGFAAWRIYKDLTKDSSPSALNAGNNPRALGTGASAIRLLDQIVTDPTLIGNPAWRKNAEEVLSDWYSSN